VFSDSLLTTADTIMNDRLSCRRLTNATPLATGKYRLFCTTWPTTTNRKYILYVRNSRQCFAILPKILIIRHCS